MNRLLLEIRLFIPKVLDFCTSLLFCLRYLPLSQAIKIPFLISYKVKIDELHKGAIVIDGAVKRFMICLGHRGFTGIAHQQSIIHIIKGAKIVFSDNVCLAQGFRLWVDEPTTVTFGKDFYCNKNCLIRATKNITFGDGVLLGWNVAINNCDGHHISIDGVDRPNDGDITIGNHVWIASDVRINKNAQIPNGAVVAQMSLVNTRFVEDRILLAGIPAKVVKRNIDWKK